MKIIIDSREPPEVINAIKKYPAFANSEIEVSSLAVGDCWIDSLVIERKTISDLLASIADNRIFNQAAEMREISEHCYFVICGALVWTQQQKIIGTNWHFRSVQGALLKVQEFGVCIVHAADDSDYPATLAWLASRDLSEVAKIQPRKTGLPINESHKVLMALPDIGDKKANVLLLKYGNVVNALVALVDDGELPAGISDKIRQNVRGVLGLSNGEYLIKSMEAKNE